MRVRDKRWVLPLAVASCALGGAAVAAGPTGPHGATEMKAQQAQLAKWVDAAKALTTPTGVDAAAWAASVPADNPMKAEVVALGNALYFEPALSADGTVACATCHRPDAAFADGRATGRGLQDLTRNTPSLVNARWQRWYGW
ncbi:MAG: cytochrome-c peroxidase, partial [Myxococcales bacterium]|nr:cytochrome-c peroxidase [Myxococcales bacterium]